MNSKPVYLFVKWQARHGQLENVLPLLQELLTSSNKETGCLFFSAFQSNDDPDTIFLYEGYTGDDTLAQHRGSEHYKELVVGKIVPLLENREVTVTTQLEWD